VRGRSGRPRRAQLDRMLHLSVRVDPIVAG
jgi:hypothetical protein